MTAPNPQPAEGPREDAPDDADLRMADVLRGSSSGAELRRELQGETTAAVSDLLSRLNALDFVQQVVGNIRRIRAGQKPDNIVDPKSGY